MSQNNKSEISHNLLVEWRRLGIISNEEVAYQVGDLFVAENVVSRDRRVIDVSSVTPGSDRRILKG
tara:strand:+ start:348 stop:545 length:198 start_codon:yes stop_codon:yes gene_type:complete